MQIRKTVTDAVETTKKSLNASMIIAAIAVVISALALLVALVN